MLNQNPVDMFIDPELDAKMVRDGFIVLPFINKQEIERFQEIYKKWHPEHPKAFYKSYFDPRMEYKLEVENEITRVFKEKFSTVFRDYNAFGGLFVVKPPTQEGHLPPHQDWSFVDERKDWSINMWCPLKDVTDENGNIIVLKGSHQFNRTIRGVGTPDVYRDHWKLIERNMQSVPLKAGEAIFFFHGLLHGSTLNTTPNSRVSLGLTLTPKNVQHYFHFMEDVDGKKQLERFETIPDFYIDYASKRGARPEGEAKLDPFTFDSLSENDLIEQIRSVRGDVNVFESTKKAKIATNWLRKIKKSILKT
ncbi:MAG: hypothetical protein ACI865_002340 [Flavobacteriaceae bacterium]|jgi:hypothetical protein